MKTEISESTETEIRARLRAEIEVLKESRNRLADLRASIPPSLEETSEEDLHGPFDLATEVRTTLASAIRDDLSPLLKKLRAAAEYRLVDSEIQPG